MKTAVITAIYDQYDTLKPTYPQNRDVEWICVTDDPELQSEDWRIVYEPRPGVHPNRAAKVPKLFPWKYTDAEYSVWVDASFRVISHDFVLGSLSYAEPIGQFIHPWRNCLYTEAEAVIGLKKYAPDSDVYGQMKAYRSAGHPESWGLWATGVISRKHTSEIKDLGEQWMKEINEHTFQDQISHPFVMRNLGLRPIEFPGWHLQNDWVTYEGSLRH